MTDSNGKSSKPASNKTSSQARELMARTLEHLAETDKDHSLKRRAKRLRKEA